MPSVFQLPEGGGQACPTKTPGRPAPMSVSATANAPPNASYGVCARSAGRPLPRPDAAYAPPAARGGASPNAPATRRERPQANPTADGNPRAVAGPRERGTGSEGANAAGRDSARAAETIPRSKAVLPVNPAARRGERPSGNSTPPGEPEGFADGAGGRLQALRSAARAPRLRTGGTGRRRTPPAGGATPDCAPSVFAPTAAANPPGERRGVSPAPATHM